MKNLTLVGSSMVDIIKYFYLLIFFNIDIFSHNDILFGMRPPDILCKSAGKIHMFDISHLHTCYSKPLYR